MKYFKRNGFVALVSMLSLTAYAGDSLPLSVAVSETKEVIQVSGHGIDTSNVVHSSTREDNTRNGFGRRNE